MSRGWLLPSGLPSRHATLAARRVAGLIDPRGSLLADLRETYVHHASDGMFIEADLIAGERMLLELGLVHQREGLLLRTDSLTTILGEDVPTAISTLIAEAVTYSNQDPATLASSPDLEDLVPDNGRRGEILAALQGKYDDARQTLIGDIGEELVLASIRSELSDIGRPDLAARARRVSLQSDALGYDIQAPRLTGQTRLLEVKATTRADVSFVLTRNEAEVADANSSDWFLVFCHVDDTATRTGRIIGWTGIGTLRRHLPLDQNHGSWQSARITSPSVLLISGLPDY